LEDALAEVEAEIAIEWMQSFDLGIIDIDNWVSTSSLSTIQSERDVVFSI
jgi:hypothetical protein